MLTRSERGSFMIAGVFFMLVFLMIAGLGVDVSNFFNKRSKLQSLADGAALAGGNAMSQYADTPATNKAFNAALSYIKSNQGDTFVDLYESHYYTNSDTKIRDLSGNMIIEGPKVDADGDTFYRFGVVTFGQFEPYFLPRQVFGDPDTLMESMAMVRVDGNIRSRQITVPLNCGLIAGGDSTTQTVISEKLNIEGADLCSNGEVDINGSLELPDGDLIQVEGASCNIGSDYNCSDRTTYKDEKTPPSFERTDTGAYDVDTEDDFSDWPSGDCTTGKVMKNQSGDTVEWSDGTEVCVARNGISPNFSYYFPNDPGGEQIQESSGDSVSIHMNGDLVWGRTDGLPHPSGSGTNGSGVKGGIYAEGNIDIYGNNHKFYGDQSELGGLALYSGEDLEFHKNGSDVEGILGADGNLTLTSSGGGTNQVKGIVMTGGGYNQNNNSSSRADVTFDKSYFDYGPIDMGNWNEAEQENLDDPYFANVNVHLIN